MVVMLSQYSAFPLFKQHLNLILSTLYIYTHYLNDKYSHVIFKHLHALLSVNTMLPLSPALLSLMGVLLPGRVLDRDKDGDTQPRAQPASQGRLWEERGQCAWPAMPCSHLGGIALLSSCSTSA